MCLVVLAWSEKKCEQFWVSDLRQYCVGWGSFFTVLKCDIIIQSVIYFVLFTTFLMLKWTSQCCVEGTCYIEVLNKIMDPLITDFLFSLCSSCDLTCGRWRNCVGGSAALMPKLWRHLFSQSEIEPSLPFKSSYRCIRILSIDLPFTKPSAQTFTKLSPLTRINCTVCVSWCVCVLWS